jgi:hypothetical protein
MAVRRNLGDELWTWAKRRSGEITPISSVTGALWLLENDPGPPAIY